MLFLFSLSTIIPDALRLLGTLICNLIYLLVANLFEVFFALAEMNLLDHVSIEPIYQRITLILTIVMVFYITFEFVKYVVQPDNISDKEKGVGNIAVKLIIVIVLIAFVPKIFTLAFDLQGRIIKNDVMSTIVLGKKRSASDHRGYAFAADMLELFYKIDDEEGAACETSSKQCNNMQKTVDEQLHNLRTKGVINMTIDITERDSSDRAYIKFDALSILVGILILYVVAMYCIDLGVRVFQLMYLQIIAPIAIIGYLTPKKDNMFSKWLKQCITTYIDVFIRLAIISFVLFIISILSELFNNGKLFAGFSDLNWFSSMLCFIALVLGLLLFAQKAPKLLQELFPSSGAASVGFGMGAKDKVGAAKKLWNAGSRSVGGAAGAIYGARRALKGVKDKESGQYVDKTGKWSAMKAGWAGLKAGAGKGGSYRKGIQAARHSIQGDLDTIAAGGSPIKKSFLGGTYYEEHKSIERRKKEFEEVTNSKKTVSATTKELKVMKNVESMKDSVKAGGNGVSISTLEMEARGKDIEKAARVYAVSRTADNLKILQDKVKTSMVGTGVLTAAQENAIKLEGQGNFVEKIKAGTLSAEIVDSLATTGNITESIKEIIKKPPTTRTEAERKQIETILTTIERETIKSLEEVNKMVATAVDKDSQIWNTTATNITESKRIANETMPDETAAMSIEEFAKKIGDIADKADSEIAKINTSSQYREAKANADEGKTSK